MSSRRYILISTLVVCASAALGIVIISMLDKEGRFVPRLHGHVFMLCSPFVAIAAGAAWWRKHRWLPFVGLAVASVAAVLCIWGNGGDYLAWSQAPRGQEVMYFGGYVAMLGSWVLFLGFLAAGAGAWLLARLRGQQAEFNKTEGEGGVPMPFGRVLLFVAACAVLFAVAGSLFAAALNWLAPGYYSGVFPQADRLGHAALTGVDTGFVQGLVLGLFAGTVVAIGLGKFGQMHLPACGRALAVLAGCAAVFAVGGGLVGLAVGVYLPDYYRDVVSGGRQPDFNPVDVGVGLGSSQGAILGVIVGAMLVIALAWRRSQPGQPASR